jgi:hypothetical protein
MSPIWTPQSATVVHGVRSGFRTAVFWHMPALHTPKQHSAALSHRRPLRVQHRPTVLLRFWKVSQQFLHNPRGLLAFLSLHLMPDRLH